MRVLVYTSSITPAGGVERVIAKHISFLSQENDVVLLTKDSTPSFYPLPKNLIRDSLGIKFHLNLRSRLQRILIISSNLLRTSWRLASYLKKNKPSLIYVASPLTLLELQIAKLFALQSSLKNVCVTEHSSYSAYNFLYKYITRFLYKRVGLLCVPTKADHQFYHSIKIRSEYLPNPLPFVPKNFTNYDHKIVLNIGRLTDDKQQSILVEIWAKTKFREGWILKIIGSGENHADLLSQISSMGLASSVVISPPTKNIEQEYASASIFTMTSRAEGFGLVLLEAMSCGLPCIAFDCPSGPRDIIQNDKSGFLVEPGDQEGFIIHLEALLKSHSLRQVMGEQAKLDALLFDEELISKKFNALISAINFRI